jgi:type II secretory pathway pseudopilin PulG
MPKRSAFTIVELLVVVSIITLLVAILLPAIGKAREQGRVSVSQANLRNLATAHASYASEWRDRQFTLCNDGLADYGTSAGTAFGTFAESNGDPGHPVSWHPPVVLGWGYRDDGAYRLFTYFQAPGQLGNHGAVQPLVFDSANGVEYFGSFRLINAHQFSQYVNGRFYDRVFYAPKDTVVWDCASPCFDDPGEYCKQAKIESEVGDIPAWASYVMSPAAMFSPAVMQHGWTDPWSIPGGFRGPTYAQARFSSLKTMMLEHHWLQNRSASDCNPGFDPGTYGGCEPWYFNHAEESAPLTLFYDGHVAGVGVRQAERADGRMRAQSGNPDWGLWSNDTPWGADGYLSEYAYDQAQTSFHILTTDGIQGRDVVDG